MDVVLPWSLLAGEYANGDDVSLGDLLGLLADLAPAPAPGGAATTTAIVTPSTADPTEYIEEGLNLGAIIGIVVGVIVILAVIVVIVVCVCFSFNMPWGPCVVLRGWPFKMLASMCLENDLSFGGFSDLCFDQPACLLVWTGAASGDGESAWPWMKKKPRLGGLL